MDDGKLVMLSNFDSDFHNYMQHPNCTAPV